MAEIIFKAYKSCRKNKYCMINNCPLNCLYPHLPGDPDACSLPQHVRERLAKKDGRLRYHGLKLNEAFNQQPAGTGMQTQEVEI